MHSGRDLQHCSIHSPNLRMERQIQRAPVLTAAKRLSPSVHTQPDSVGPVVKPGFSLRPVTPTPHRHFPLTCCVKLTRLWVSGTHTCCLLQWQEKETAGAFLPAWVGEGQTGCRVEGCTSLWGRSLEHFPYVTCVLCLSHVDL